MGGAYKVIFSIHNSFRDPLLPNKVSSGKCVLYFIEDM